MRLVAAGAAKLGTDQRRCEFEPELNVAAGAAKLGTDQRQCAFEPELNVAAGASALCFSVGSVTTASPSALYLLYFRVPVPDVCISVTSPCHPHCTCH